MLCRTCACMLRGGTGQQWNGTYDLTFKHHARTESLRRSREAGCSICIALANELRHEMDLLDDQDISIDANLSELKGGQWKDGGVYRLDFILEKRRTRTFVLRPTGE
ncbi:heterokaryon incompatibility protein [Diplodia corticola]|uniref:Heterokaryon incompatibility protein n=1 Tax=Diplodia corticola TaxID=236234 RepID=A0A1J9S666_9PEZI|nr:heterokaryon incompatibility protein [Diplodia corticola]OJD36015.1 heterokaryon incompatibility protein [Diplodia corticola]